MRTEVTLSQVKKDVSHTNIHNLFLKKVQNQFNDFQQMLFMQLDIWRQKERKRERKKGKKEGRKKDEERGKEEGRKEERKKEKASKINEGIF